MQSKTKDLTVDTTGYQNKDANCMQGIKARMEERNPNPKEEEKMKTEQKKQNGVKMPIRKSDALRVWQISDHLACQAQKPPERQDVTDFCKNEGIKESTAKRNHSLWRKFHGADDVVVDTSFEQEVPVVSAPESTTDFDVEEIEASIAKDIKTAGTAPVIPDPQLAAWQLPQPKVLRAPNLLDGWQAQTPEQCVQDTHVAANELDDTTEVPVLTTEKDRILALNNLRTVFNLILQKGKIQVYIDQPLKDVRDIIVSAIKDNPQQVLAFLKAQD